MALRSLSGLVSACSSREGSLSDCIGSGSMSECLNTGVSLQYINAYPSGYMNPGDHFAIHFILSGGASKYFMSGFVKQYSFSTYYGSGAYFNVPNPNNFSGNEYTSGNDGVCIHYIQDGVYLSIYDAFNGRTNFSSPIAWVQ